MPGIHFSLRMADAEIAELAAREVADLVGRLLPEVFEPVSGPVAHSPEQAEALAHLHLLTYLQQAVDQLEAKAAHQAADAGAGYPQIGRASNLTRQGARRRWPGLLNQPPSPADPPAPSEPGSPR
ncbi:hypothetical protein ACIHAA_01830 [Streptomyces sp. NPDC052040]|uniref:hypothetical protein n=1 Tax=unclassified Streptomyces TaxID=2593676 RepID=UPI0037CF7DF0